MKETWIKTGAVVTGGTSSRVLKGAKILVRDGKISVLPSAKDGRKTTVDLSDRVAIPGFVQTHIHLCQTDARGLADDLSLLDWLKTQIMPYEAALTPKTLRAAVRRGLRELLLSGTTCIMDMGTLRHTEVIAEEMLASGIRGYFGKCLMDQNDLRPEFKEGTDRALSEAAKLAKRWHEKNGRLRYAWAPRFVLTCSETLIRESFELVQKHPGTRFHMHASENPLELQAIRAKCGMDNIEYLDRLGVVSERSCLAHCVHLSEREVSILASRNAHVLHCPSANLKLASGIADIVGYRKRGISVSLGTDGAACNNHLDIWTEMRLASLLQKPKHGADAMPARETFLMATLGGAKALGWGDEIGSLEEGKAADIVFVDLGRGGQPRHLETEDDYYGALVYSGRPDLVTDVMIAGQWVVRKGVLKRW